ncbi:MAG TPA: lytic transglycosylase domain-containing protein [Gemmatimonadaceae bacterium]
MPTRWTLPTRFLSRAKQAGARHGVKSAIVLAGAAIAAGTLYSPAPQPKASLVQNIVAMAPMSAPAPTIAESAQAKPDPKPSLDNGSNHSRITSWVKRFSSSDAFKVSLDRMSKYEDMITAKLDERDMPRDLIYLAMIESNFDPKARSPVKAVGMWQFMSATAKRFGLTVRGKVDERKDPARSTDAALTYLSKLYDRFGSWYLAAAAYNSGEGRVSRALDKVTGKKTGTDADFFRILPALPKETRDYVPKLIAAARVGNDPAKYGVD